MSCKYCESESSVFEGLCIHDSEDDCKWCTHDICVNYDDSCYGVGYANVPVNFCPNCGAELKKQ